MFRIPIDVAAVLLPLVLVGPVSAGNVIVVDSQGGGHFQQIQPAIEAAQDGDTILVKSGSYVKFWIVNHELAVVADYGHTVTINGSVEVRSLAQGKDVLLSGLTLVGFQDTQTWSGVGLRLKNDIGAVRVQGCTLRGTNSGIVLYGSRPGATVEGCTDVCFTGCTFEGSDVTSTSGATSGEGLRSTASAVSLYDCVLRGGDGTGDWYTCWGCTDGCAGAITDSFLFASGTSFTGGDAGSADSQYCCANDGCDGGDGILIQSPGGDVHLVDSACLGGIYGDADCCSIGCATDGHWGSPIDPPGSAQYLFGPARRFDLPPVVRDPSAVPVTVQGVPGDEAWLHLTRNPEFEFQPSLNGIQLTQGAPYALTIPLGTLPASGSLSTQIAVPAGRAREVPSGREQHASDPSGRSTIYQLQVQIQASGGQGFLTNGRSLVVLD